MKRLLSIQLCLVVALFLLIYSVAASSSRSALIRKYEESGNYAVALQSARNCRDGSMGETTKRLEEKLLTLGASRIFFDEHFEPRAKLLTLLDIVGMEPINGSEKAVLQINRWAQQNLLRQGERWEEQTIKFEKLKPRLKPLLTELGFINATTPHFKEYTGAIVHGAFLPRVRSRLHYLVEQWKAGCRFSHLYFLSGERPLAPQHENRAALLDDSETALKIRKGWIAPAIFPKTESEMTQFVWEQADIPDEMRASLQVHFVNAPMKQDLKSGTLIRPTTDDTIEVWLQEKPITGNYLAISNAPYTNRQDLVVRAIAPACYRLDTVGAAANENEKMAIILDEVARFIFQTKQLYEKTAPPQK